jgi:hypothetical protein
VNPYYGQKLNKKNKGKEGQRRAKKEEEGKRRTKKEEERRRW